MTPIHSDTSAEPHNTTREFRAAFKGMGSSSCGLILKLYTFRIRPAIQPPIPKIPTKITIASKLEAVDRRMPDIDTMNAAIANDL